MATTDPRRFVGKAAPPVGLPRSILLHNPRYAHNVGMVLRLASCFALRQLWFTGDRVKLDDRRGRLPREERMRGYEDVEVYQYDHPFEQMAGVTPVAIEVRENAESLLDFEHPEDALYVFGPEDGSLSRGVLQQCHRFVVIPTAHCLNLATAVSTVLWDRMAKRHRAGLPAEVMAPLGPFAGFEDTEPGKLGLYDAGSR